MKIGKELELDTEKYDISVEFTTFHKCGFQHIYFKEIFAYATGYNGYGELCVDIHGLDKNNQTVSGEYLFRNFRFKEKEKN